MGPVPPATKPVGARSRLWSNSRAATLLGRAGLASLFLLLALTVVADDASSHAPRDDARSRRRFV